MAYALGVFSPEATCFQSLPLPTLQFISGMLVASFVNGDVCTRGTFVSSPGIFWGFLHRFRLALLGAMAFTAYCALLWVLRTSSYSSDPQLHVYLEMAGSLVAFTFAANALVRFRGTHDRLSLILAFGFVLAGLIEATSTLTFYRGMLVVPSTGEIIPLAWLAGRTLLATLLVAALVVENRVPVSRDPEKEMAASTLIVGASAYLTSAFYFLLPHAPSIHSTALIPRPWDLLPASLYVVATIGFGLRLRREHAVLDKALFLAAALNAICHFTMSQSQRMLDAPFTLGQWLMVLSYVVVLGGTLLDNAKLFDQVSRLADSDSLTGLANHRRLVEVLENEMERSRRTNRSFALLLFDLDALKKVNDQFGHLMGSHAIRRVGNVLKTSCRSIDTAARFGGDEFAIVLPESDRNEAAAVASRICERVLNDGQKPAISVSIGLSVFPQDGTTIDALIGTADIALYRMKRRGDKKFRLGQVAACL
jgi:diguanylate cyclase (GGDEF)-like protein